MSAEPDPAAEVGTELLIDQLDRDVQYVIVTGEIPIRRYLDGARQLMLQGDKSFLANDYAAAYKSYKKFVRLVLVDLKKHMFYSSANNKKEIDELNGFAWDALKNKLETKIAPKIQGRRVPIRGGATAAPAAAAGDDTETADLTARLSALAMSKTTGDGGAAGATVPAPASLVSAAPASSLASIYTPKPPAGSLTAASVPLADSAVGQASSRGMRPLHLPVALIAKFKALCEANTAAGIETCALLMGKEVDVIGAAPVAVAAPAAPAVKKANADMTEEEAMAALAGGGDGDAKPAAASASSAAAATAPGTLVVTHMVLPEQRGTANSVETFNEEAIVAVQEQHGVYVMGWVHTHPTQTCFLSSVDLHCQCSYQNMLPEAVAMVIAPKYVCLPTPH
jgi:proteasome lid subunit RPN8/RPN11